MQQDCWQNGCHYRLSNRHGARKFSDIASEYKQQEKQEPQARPRKPVQGHPCFKQALGIPQPITPAGMAKNGTTSENQPTAVPFTPVN